MNKRKTLRMTSILLALMMFFGMVSVLLVPSGVAAAADGVNVIIGPGTTTATTRPDSDNVVSDQYSQATLEISKDFNDDGLNYTRLAVTIITPSGATLSGHSRQNATLTNGIYYYNVPISSSMQKGLYQVKLERMFQHSNGTWTIADDANNTLGAFWLYETESAWMSTTAQQNLGHNGSTYKLQQENTTADGTKFVGRTTATGTNWVGPEADMSIKGLFLGNVAQRPNIPNGDYISRVFDPYTLKIDSDVDFDFTAATADVRLQDAEFEVPEDATHERVLDYGYLLIKDDDSTSAGFCKLLPVLNNPTNGIGSHQATVDSKAPVVKASEVTMTFGMYHKTNYNNYQTTPQTLAEIEDGTKFFVEATNPAGTALNHFSQIRFQMKNKNSVTDADSGVIIEAATPYTGLSAWLFEPGQGAAKMMTSTTAPSIISKYSENAVLAVNYPSAVVQWKAGGRYKFIFRATDAVGNTSDLSTGFVDIDAKYNPIKAIDAVINEYTLAVGDEILFEDLQAWTKAVIYALDPTLSATDINAWSLVDETVAGANPLRDYFDIEYDDDNVKIVKLTAKKAGQTTIQLKPSDVYFNLTAASMTNWASQIYTTNSFENNWIVPESNRLYFTITEPSENPATSVTVSPKTKELSVGEKFIPTATVGPTTAYDRTVNWVSSKPAVATVDATTGEVTAVADGEAWIYARSNMNSGVQDSCLVTVGKTVDPDPVPEPKPDDGWKDEGNNRYYYIDGQKVVGWRKIDGSWYFFDYTSAAMRANGWLKEGGKWYYLNSNGTMKSAEWFKDNNGKWYWLKANGAMAAGWEKINGTWYYFNASGAMQTGWVNVRGIWYYMKSSGAMAEGWLQDGGSWYYLTPGGGAMVTGRVTINGRASNFATSGRWLGYV